jgi:hypothetical protein
MAAVDLQAGRVVLPVQEMPQGDVALGVDLSSRAIRERAFARECLRIAEAEEAKAARKGRRASRLPLSSNGRRKLELAARQLEEHAGLMRAAATMPDGHGVADLGRAA